jgi:hypothetical protein
MIQSELGARACPKTGGDWMEDSRCNFAAVEMEDPRCKGLRGGVAIEMEDPRCKSMLSGKAMEMEDPRCKSMLSSDAMVMEEPAQLVMETSTVTNTRVVILSAA